MFESKTPLTQIQFPTTKSSHYLMRAKTTAYPQAQAALPESIGCLLE